MYIQYVCVYMYVYISLHRYVDDVISRIGRMFPDMTIELFRPNGTSAVLLVRVLLLITNSVDTTWSQHQHCLTQLCLTSPSVRWPWARYLKHFLSCVRSSSTEPLFEDTTRIITMRTERSEVKIQVMFHVHNLCNFFISLRGRGWFFFFFVPAGHLDQV